MSSLTHASVSVAIGANLGSSFANSFNTANKQVSKLGSTIKRFDSQASKIELFKKSGSDVLGAKRSWQQAQLQVRQLSQEIKATDKPTKKLQNNFRRAKNAARLAKIEFTATRDSTRQMGRALRETGIDTKNLATAQNKLGRNLATLRNQQSAMFGIQNARNANLMQRQNYRSQMMDAVALGGALYGAIRPAVDFELAMAKVGAIVGESADSEDFKQLTAQARELGRETQYTASQAAEGMKYLGMTGMKTNQILAATPSVLNMAIAADMDLGRAADIASNILSGFNMKAERTAEVADILAQASRTANVDIEMLGQTMKFVAPAAATVGGTLQETAAIAGVLGDAGIQATMAGTMLRSAYLRLAAPASAGAKALAKMREEMGIAKEEMPDIAKEAMLAQSRLKGMGVEIFKDGKMRSMVDILKDMQKALRGVNDEQKLSIVKDIFGTRAASGALAIFKSIESGRLDEVYEKVKKADGVAKEMADRLKNTTTGAFKQFASAMESVGIAVGNVLLPAFRDIALGMAYVAGKVSSLSEKFPVLTKVIGLTIAGLITFKITAIAVGYAWTFIRGGFLAAKAAVIAFRTALILTNIAMAGTRFGAIIAGVTALGASMYRVALGAIPAVVTGIRAIGLAFVTSPIGLAITAIAGGALLVMKYWQPLSGFFEKLFAPVLETFDKVWKGINKLTKPMKKVGHWVGSTWDKVTGNNKSTKSPDEPNISSHRNNHIHPAATSPQTHNNSRIIKMEAPITINATNGMDAKSIAVKVKEELNNLLREHGRQRNSINYDY